MAIVWSLVFVAWRGVRASAYFRVPPGIAWIFAASEVLALVTTIIGLGRGRVSRGVGGYLVPVCYLVPLMFDPLGQRGPTWTVVAFLGCVLAQWFVRLWLGSRCSVGVPVLVSVRSSGPYSIIRHPLALTEIGIAAAFACRVQSERNSIVLLLCIIAGVVCVAIEEKFLLSDEEYRNYASVVRWRLVPGIW